MLYGTETLIYLGPKIWDLFKQLKEIKKRKLDRCPYRVCKIYIPNLGFVD